MIALGDSWLARRLGGSRWSVIITSHAGCADDRRTPCPPLNPVAPAALGPPSRTARPVLIQAAALL